jgi:ubiquinone biosynthesis protein
MHALVQPASVLLTGVEFRVRRDALRQTPERLGKWLGRRLPILGPTYTKLGQFVSSRPDVFGPELCKQLYTLQDNVSPMDFALVNKRIKGTPVHDRLHSIDPAPLASASIAQVHRATMNDGTKVVLKVMRPNILARMRHDISLINFMLASMERGGMEGVDDTQSLVDQFATQLFGEADFVREKETMMRFARMYESNPCLRVPRVFDELCSDSVLVMEYMPSKKMDADNIPDIGQRRQAAILLMGTFLSQMLSGGLTHADPHGGNIGLHPYTNQLVLYDFGNVIDLDKDMQRALKQIMMLVIERDVDGMVEMLPQLGITVRDPEAIRFYVSSYLDYITSLDVNKLFSATVPQEAVSKVPMKVSIQLLCLMRVFSMLEGTCKNLDPDFQYMNVAPVMLVQLFGDPDVTAFKMERDLRNFLTPSSSSA